MSAALFALSAALLSGGVAGASPAADPGAGEEARSTHQRIVDYWTPARRAAAVPRVVGPESRAKGGKPGGGGDSTGTVTGATWPNSGAAVAKTTGKVFLTLDGVNYVCSGAAVGGSVNLVLSAGHCVWDDALDYATNWMFAPGYNGTFPYGKWTATALFTTSEWATTTGDAWADDAGMAVVTNDSSGTLAGMLGTLPTMADTSVDNNLADDVYSAFGYPAAQRYKGKTLSYCQGPVDYEYDGKDTLSMACDMTGGSSGGPWYSQANGGGQIVSVNSYGYRSLARMFGPTFNGQEGSMKASAANGTCDEGEVCSNIQ